MYSIQICAGQQHAGANEVLDHRGVYRHALLLTIVPIAKDSIFESMREGAIVLDSSNRLVDYNRSLRDMLPKA